MNILSPEILSVLGELGAAGALLVVVFIFLKHQRSQAETFATAMATMAGSLGRLERQVSRQTSAVLSLAMRSDDANAREMLIKLAAGDDL